MRKISVLGSTGSIGTQTLTVAKDLGNIQVTAITANSNYRLFAEQIREFKPLLAVLTDDTHKDDFLRLTGDTETRILFGKDHILQAATLPETDTVVNALVGNIGLLPTVSAIQAGKDVALANKEVLVTGGSIIMPMAKEKGVKILPVDSEHSAIFQCLQGNEGNRINKIFLTASGGPFLNFTRADLEKVTPEDALKHPNWTMGSKITIDSATLMNKGLELIEAHWLFGVNPDDITVVIHPQSIIHSMVEYADGAVMAQLGVPDMKVPIQYALTYPKRLDNPYPTLNFFEQNSLTFYQPDYELFSCLKLAIQAIKTGGIMPTVLNAANEIAVSRFLSKDIAFLDIPVLIEQTMLAYTSKKPLPNATETIQEKKICSEQAKHSLSLQDILFADTWSREFAKNYSFSKA